MIEYAPIGFGPNDSIGMHNGLRVTFAQTRSAFTPDFVERADFRDNIDHLITEMALGGFALAPASDITIAPDEFAATIDFAVVSPGSVSVAQALVELERGLYGFLDITRRTYIRRVELLGQTHGNDGTEWGNGIPDDLDVPDPECDILCKLQKAGWLVGTAAVLGLVVYFAPEIKTALKLQPRSRS